MVLKFELPNARVLNFPKISALSLIVLVLINGDCVYVRGPFDHRQLTARHLTTEGVVTFDRKGACDILHTPFIILSM